MKYLENESIEKLLGIIPEHPATRIMQISKSEDRLYPAIKKFCLMREYEYLMNVIDIDYYEQIRPLANHDQLHTIKKMTLDQRVYASMSKQYDFIFVTADIPLAFENRFAQKIHRYIKNSGNIILFLAKEDRDALRRWYQHLEEHLFVAISTIDIFENYELLIAKKMHGWGEN
jgi:hypothetical protein